VARLWTESRSVPELAIHALAVHRLLAQEATVAIDRAIRRRDDVRLLAVIAEAEQAGVAPSVEARKAARGARQRQAAQTALREAMDRGDLTALAALACSGQLDCLE